MGEQLLLPGIEPPKAHTDRVFFALQPPEPAASAIAALSRQLKADLGLKGKLIPVGRLHVTLNFFGNHVGLPQGLLQALSDAAGELRFEPFDVVFDRVMSFKAGGGRKPPFVLRGGDEGLAPLMHFRREIDDALARRRLAHSFDLRFTPHVTLMYGHKMVMEQAVAPITWRVSEFVLIDSLIGHGQHIVMGRWPSARTN
jgi:RNA 2',3'-cyclic 3'-phosphodiesterase